jgi:HD-GYP domain-containing protein (c-di-GMP phosphodiesterase class II)
MIDLIEIRPVPFHAIKLIDVLVRAMSEHDPDTAQHLEATARIAEQTARAMGLPEPIVTRSRNGARLHDIGKIDLDLNILRKPGKLTSFEWKLVKLHPGRGEEILREIPLLRELAPIVGAHHERFDGRGYPNNLMSHEIPLESRIISVADAFEAMTGWRSYRKPLSVDAALFELAANSGTQFDPAVVNAFLAAHAMASEDRKRTEYVLTGLPALEKETSRDDRPVCEMWRLDGLQCPIGDGVLVPATSPCRTSGRRNRLSVSSMSEELCA